MTAPVLAAVPASTLIAAPRRSPEIAPTGIAELDRLLGGLPRGAIAEIAGPASSGRTTLAAACLREATSRGECVAYIDARNAADPASLAAAGVDLERLLWVRCTGDAEAALKAADLVLHAGGFGLVCLDLGGVGARELNRIPFSCWFRFRRALAGTRTALLVLGDRPAAGSCAAFRLRFDAPEAVFSGQGPGRLFRGFRSRLEAEAGGRRRGVSFRAAAA